MRVEAVNVSAGGVPKSPVERAWVGSLGLEGDAHSEPTVHGGPYRAVCLFGMEVIDRLRSEGHPVDPGSVGENLTTSGIDWSSLPGGTRIRVGAELVLELTTPASPCDTQTHNFIGGRIGRISIKNHPSDSRMYARVLTEGEVRVGDPIKVLPAEPGAEPGLYALMNRIDDCETESNLRLWQAATACGMDVRIIDDGELAVAATPGAPGPALNLACGLRTLPNFLSVALDHFRSAGVVGWLPMEDDPWPDAEPELELELMAADVDDVEPSDPVDGVTVRRLPADEWRTWTNLMLAALEGEETQPAAGLIAPAPHLMAKRGVHVVVAEEEGVAVGAGVLHVHRHIGLMRAGMVVAQARGRGIQRALIGARAALARELGCDVVVSQAPPETASARNLARMGLEPIWRRQVYRFDGTA